MKVQDAILQLQEMYNPNDEIIIAWWTHDAFEHVVDKENWAANAEYADDQMDWSDAHDRMVFLIEDNMEHNYD